MQADTSGGIQSRSELAFRGQAPGANGIWTHPDTTAPVAREVSRRPPARSAGGAVSHAEGAPARNGAHQAPGRQDAQDPGDGGLAHLVVLGFGSFSSHFDGKEQLFQTAAEEVLERWGDLIDRAPPTSATRPSGSPWARGSPDGWAGPSQRSPCSSPASAQTGQLRGHLTAPGSARGGRRGRDRYPPDTPTPRAPPGRNGCRRPVLLAWESEPVIPR